jgi:hypothetical protein
MAKIMIAAGRFCKLNEELSNYSKNIFETEKLLQRFVFQQELKRTGIWLTADEVKRQASHYIKCLLDSNLIQNGLIVPGMREHIEEVTV